MAVQKKEFFKEFSNDYLSLNNNISNMQKSSQNISDSLDALQYKTFTSEVEKSTSWDDAVQEAIKARVDKISETTKALKSAVDESIIPLIKKVGDYYASIRNIMVQQSTYNILVDEENKAQRALDQLTSSVNQAQWLFGGAWVDQDTKDKINRAGKVRDDFKEKREKKEKLLNELSDQARKDRATIKLEDQAFSLAYISANLDIGAKQTQDTLNASATDANGETTVIGTMGSLEEDYYNTGISASDVDKVREMADAKLALLDQQLGEISEKLRNGNLTAEEAEKLVAEMNSLERQRAEIDRMRTELDSSAWDLSYEESYRPDWWNAYYDNAEDIARAKIRLQLIQESLQGVDTSTSDFTRVNSTNDIPSSMTSEQQQAYMYNVMREQETIILNSIQSGGVDLPINNPRFNELGAIQTAILEAQITN